MGALFFGGKNRGWCHLLVRTMNHGVKVSMGLILVQLLTISRALVSPNGIESCS